VNGSEKPAVREAPEQQAEALQVEALLRPYAAQLRRSARLATPESLLWRARLRERLAHAETAQRLLSIYDRVAIGVGLAAAAVVTIWKWEAIREALPDLSSAAATAGHASNTAIIAGAVLALAGLVVWAVTVWAED
jgi:hypothetical protein